MPDPDFHNLTWERGEYLLSTEKRWINIEKLRAIYASPLLSWAKSLPPKAMKKMVDNSICFSLVHFPANGAWELIGFARIVTDYTTFGYLSDVFVLEEYQGKGLGRWMMSCIPELLEQMPDLRGLVLMTEIDGHGQRFYQETLGTRRLPENYVVLEVEGRGSVHH